MTFEIKHLKNKVYYSQNREDLLLEAFFPELTDGFYVDVGAYDPTYDSVTKLFYEKGWRGINIEPQIERYEKFKINRPRDINLNCGVSDTEGELILRSYDNGGLSTFSNKMKNEYEKDNESVVGDYKDVKVKVDTLCNIFKKYETHKINFLKIDAEGLEYEVLLGNDWELYRPQVLCIESNNILKNWKTFLIKNNYKFIFFDGLNDYYIDSLSKDIKKFDYVEHIINLRGNGIGYEDFKKIQKLHERFEESKKYSNYLEWRVQEMTEEVDSLNRRLSSVKDSFNRFRELSIIRVKSKFKKIK